MPSTSNEVNAHQDGVQTVNSGAWTGSTLTQYNTLVGGANSAITSVIPSPTSGVPLISQGASANPAFGTAAVAGGGTGSSSFNTNGVLISGATTTSALTALTLSDGQLVIGSTGNAPVAATLTQGTNISITNAAGSITISSSGLASFSWNTVSTTSQACIVNQGYLSSNAAATSMYLPSNPAVGTMIRFSNEGSASIKIYPATGQMINFLYNSFSAPNYLTSSDPFSALCVVSASSTDWNVISDEGSWRSIGPILSGAFASTDFLYVKITNQGFGTGRNNLGELANYSTTAYSSPVATVFPLTLPLVQVSGGASFSAWLDTAGHCWTCGDSTSGALGNNTASPDVSSPVSVVGGFSFTQIAVGANRSLVFSWCLGLKADGTVWSWGDNTDGQLGTRNTTNYSSPVSVIGNHSFIQVICEEGSASLGLKANGTVWGWGVNRVGNLGDQTTASKSSPVSVVGNHSFIKITGGDQAGYGLKIDGSVWSWGDNSLGQLGNLSTANRSSPVSVVGNHSFIDIVANSAAACGLKASGAVWTWGGNTNGELGNQTAGNHSSPVAVVGNLSFIKLTTGGASSFNFAAVTADGLVWGWGLNNYGQLGNNTATNFSSPILILNTP